MEPFVYCCVYLWSLHFKKDTDKLERVQRKITSDQGLGDNSYRKQVRTMRKLYPKREKGRNDVILCLKECHVGKGTDHYRTEGQDKF